MTQDRKCPKCQGDMVQGFVPDQGRSQKLVSSWVEGQPQRSWWQGTKTPLEGGIPIGAFRCKGCGYLEFYANHKFAAE